MMKLVAQKKMTVRLVVFNDDVIFTERIDKSWRCFNLYCYRNNEFVTLYEGEFRWGIPLKKHLVFLKKEGSDLYVYDKNFDLVTCFEGIWYFASLIEKVPNKIQLLKYLVEDGLGDRIPYLLTENLIIEEIKEIYDLECSTVYILYSGSDTQVSAYSKTDESLVWTVDVTGIGCYKENTDNGIVEHPNSIDQPVFGNSETVFVPLRGGQLLALDAETGNTRWLLDKNGGYVLFYEFVYMNNGTDLFEIDIEKGVVIRSLFYNNVPELYAASYALYGERAKYGMFRCTGSMEVYPDYIVLRAQSQGWVIFIDRHTFQLAHLVEVGARMPSVSQYIRWHNNKLYVQDMEDTLHIFEPE